MYFFLELGFTMNAKTYFQKFYAKILRAWGKDDNIYQNLLQFKHHK
jgi:hypothetical protein